MRCPICGLVVEESEQPTAEEVAKGYTACNGCWTSFTTDIKAGVAPEEAARKARKLHHDAEMVKWDAMQAKAAALLDEEARAQLADMVREASK